MNTAAPHSDRQRYTEFLFRGNAVAASGFVNRRGQTPVPLDPAKATAHGVSCLPMAGGVSKSSVPEPDLPFRKNIRYLNCETLAHGGPEGESMVTTIRTSVTDVEVTTSPSPEDNVPNVGSITFNAKRLSIAVRSVHPPSGQARFEILGDPENVDLSMSFTDLKGNTRHTPIRLVFNRQLMALRTLDELDEQLKNPTFFDQHKGMFRTLEQAIFGNPAPRTRDGYVVCSIVEKVIFGDKEYDHVLPIPGFGKISFGVMVTDEISRRISLVRVKFGSDPGGTSCLNSVETNGIWQ